MIKFCIKCKLETERNAKNGCKVCARLKSAEWRKNNPEKIVTERTKAKNAEWRKANPEKVKASCKKWRKANAEKVKKTRAIWVKNNAKLCRIHCNNRRVRMAGGSLSLDIVDRLFRLQKGLCPCCKMPLGIKFHVDHIMPISLGGTNTDNNVQLLKATCNLKKNAKDPIDYMQSKGFLC